MLTQVTSFKVVHSNEPTKCVEGFTLSFKSKLIEMRRFNKTGQCVLVRRNIFRFVRIAGSFLEFKKSSWSSH